MLAMNTTAPAATATLSPVPMVTSVLKVTARSGNLKTGPIPVTSRGQWSCPTTCPFMGSGCYGENHGRGGSPTLFDYADAAERPHDVESLAVGMRQSGRPAPGARRQLPLVRDREVGDILTADGAIDRPYLSLVRDAARRMGRRVFGYTHVPEVTADDIPEDYVMNASCETPEGVRDAWSRGLPAVIVGDRDALQAADSGARYVSCPAEVARPDGRKVTCSECGLCAMPRRMSAPADVPVVVFAPHGTQKRKARAAVAARLGK